MNPMQRFIDTYPGFIKVGMGQVINGPANSFHRIGQFFTAAFGHGKNRTGTDWYTKDALRRSWVRLIPIMPTVLSAITSASR